MIGYVIAFWGSLDPADRVVLVGIAFTLIVSLFTLAQASHKNKVDGITIYRMEWIKEVRILLAELLAYDPMSALWKSDGEKLSANIGFRKTLNQLKLHLNLAGQPDKELLYKCDLLYYIDNSMPNDVDEDFVKYQILFFKTQAELFECASAYLKSEWVRVKGENHILRWPPKYWSYLRKFNENAVYQAMFERIRATQEGSNRNAMEIILNAELDEDEKEEYERLMQGKSPSGEERRAYSE